MRTAAIAGREWRALLLSPVGWIITALFVAACAIVFTLFTFDDGQLASMRNVFNGCTWMFMALCPAISMRTIAEERRSGTYELLMTSPLSEAQIIVGKFIGAWGFLIVMLVPTAVFVLLLEKH